MKQRILLLLIPALWILAACKETKPAANQPAGQLIDNAEQYINQGKYDSAKITLQTALKALKNDTTSLSWIRAMKNHGVIHDITGNYDSSSYYLYRALRMAEKTDQKEIQLKIFGDIGILYFDLRKQDDAVANYQKMLEMAEMQHDSTNMARALNNMGNAYATLSHDFKKAIPCFERTLEIAQRIKYEAAVRTTKNILAQIYIETGELDKAYREIRELQEKYGDDVYFDFSLAAIYAKKGAYDKSIGAYQAILGKAFDTQELRLAVLYSLSEVYKEKGDLQNTLKYIQEYHAAKDSLHTLQAEKDIQNMKLSYETEKKELKIASMEEERRLMIGLVVAAGIVFVMILAFIYYRQRNQRKMVEQKLRQLEQEKQLVATQAVLDGETAERMRLARDLHDGLGSLLSVAKLGLQGIKSLTIEPEDSKQLEGVMATIDNSMKELRRVAHNLMPESLARNGLKTALTDFCGNIPAVAFHYFGTDERLEQNMEVAVYRVIHELVNNALKHAEAEKIDVQLIQNAGEISLSVCDNGKGFDSNILQPGMGIKNIQNRIASYNGHMDLWSQPDEGTEIHIRLSKTEN